MSTTPVSVHAPTRFDGQVFVPEEPVDLPVGTTLEGEAQRPTDLGSDVLPQPEKPLASQEEWLTFLDRTAGTWVGPEMEDPDDLPPAEPDF